MKTVINQHLFRHFETKSAAFNNLCTIIHKLADEGIYVGEVVQDKRLLGSFRLTYDKKSESSQVMVPSTMLLTRQDAWVQTALKHLNWPAVGWVTTTPTSE